MHDGMPYGRNQGQGHSREVDRQSPTGLFFYEPLVKYVLVLSPIVLTCCHINGFSHYCFAAVLCLLSRSWSIFSRVAFCWLCW